MDPISIEKGLAILVQAIQHITTNPLALDRIREKLPSGPLRKPKEIETMRANMNKVMCKGKGWNHHK